MTLYITDNKREAKCKFENIACFDIKTNRLVSKIQFLNLYKVNILTSKYSCYIAI